MQNDFERAYVDEDNVIRWKSNDNVPPEEPLKRLNEKHGDKFNYQKSKRVRKRETQKKLQEYRERMKNSEPSSEQIREMKSAFGKNATVTNVITGEETDLSDY